MFWGPRFVRFNRAISCYAPFCYTWAQRTETNNKTIYSVYAGISFKYSDLLANAMEQDLHMNNISDNFATEAQAA
jgi:hypothetical protein